MTLPVTEQTLDMLLQEIVGLPSALHGAPNLGGFERRAGGADAAVEGQDGRDLVTAAGEGAGQGGGDVGQSPRLREPGDFRSDVETTHPQMKEKG